ncbi:phage minor head protein [Arsukibacterium sp.]|uniref:phage minor head protein n=1 Tax=Arsukibacterium sp. TaxID=1977258 RepID=UPI00299D452D|nr:phage minor head protein [Arsukibacterium sp.]MDX1536390.1 phage minor head protein [Arsukibacterium sp.]
MATAEYGSLPFDAAIAYFRKKVNLPSERWTDIWRQQHDVAFTVAGAMKTDLLADMRGAVDAAIANGKSLTWFKSQFKDMVKRHGWDHTGEAAWRANVIYGTNMRQSYNAGRYQQLQQFEFWRYKHGDSQYPRLNHLSKDGLVLPKASPFWQVWFPQNGWGCKCKVFGETAASVKRKGLTVSAEPDIEYRDWVDKKTGEVQQVPVGIDPGFDYAPGSTSQVTKVKAQVAAKPKLAERLPERIVPSAFSTIKGVTAEGIDGLLVKLDAPQLTALNDFMKAKATKTIFVKQTEMSRGKKSAALAAPIAEYLGVDEFYAQMKFTSRSPARVGGFTAMSWEHIVVKAKANDSLSKVDMLKVREVASEVIQDAAGNKGPHIFGTTDNPLKRHWTVSELVEKRLGESARLISTWLHELGHQVHYYAGAPDYPAGASWVTYYAATNKYESFAEAFTAWMLAPKALKQWQPELYEHLEQQIQKATKARSKTR